MPVWLHLTFYQAKNSRHLVKAHDSRGGFELLYYLQLGTKIFQNYRKFF